MHTLLRLGILVLLALALALPGGTEAALIDVNKLTSSDAHAFDQFGNGVAVSGDIAIVGAPQTFGGGPGAVYIFERNQSGADNWSEVMTLTASDAQLGDFFGASVALSGDTAVVGAIFESAGGSDAGAAYVFRRDQGGADSWGQVTKLTASDAQAFDIFGVSVAISGDTAIVGALGEDAGGDAAGAAYIFERDQGGTDNWGEVKKLTASDAQADDEFSFSVGVSGDAAVVGARLEDAVGDAAGAAYIFERDQGGPGNWGEVKKLLASDAQAGDQFGYTAALSGNTAVVGARLEEAGGSQAGAAYIFERDQGGPGNWGEVKKLTSSNAQLFEKFGNSVAVSGDIAIVGATQILGGGPGAAYIFERDQGGPGNWGEAKKLTASDPQAVDAFGYSVAVNGYTSIVGAPFEDAGGGTAGAAYVFQGKDPEGDTDGDTIPNADDLNDDNDACSDEQELGNNETLGGRRNPHNFWDFFDPNRDRTVSLLDFFAILRHFGTTGDPSTLDPNAPEPAIGEYWALADRGGQVPGGDPWDELPANGSIGLSDFLSVLRQFGHTCA